MAKKKQRKAKGKGGKPKKAAKKLAAAKNGKQTTEPKGAKTKAEKKAPPANLDALKAVAKGAQAGLDKAKAEAEGLRKKAAEVESKAKDAYRVAVAPYRDACRKAGVECEFAGAKAPPVAPRVRFLVERVKGGIKVAIKGKPKTEEVIPDATLRKSVGRAAFDYCERALGPVSQYGNKHAGLSQRFRIVLAKS